MELKKEEQVGESTYIQHGEFTNVGEFKSWAEHVISMLEDATAKGYTNVYPQIVSTMEPYEDYLSDPEVQIWGSRLYNDTELLRHKRQQEIRELANKLGCTYGEADVLSKLPKAKLKAFYE